MGDRTHLSMRVHPEFVESDAWKLWNETQGETEDDSVPGEWYGGECNYGLNEQREWLADQGVVFAGYHGEGGEYPAFLFYSDGEALHEWPCDSCDYSPTVITLKGRIDPDSLKALETFALAHYESEQAIEKAWDRHTRAMPMIEGDRIDARAMAAVEIWEERQYRIHGGRRRLTPAERLDILLVAGIDSFREQVERENGEEAA